jgi:hypothetical protein
MNREEIRDLVIANIGGIDNKDSIINSYIDIAISEICKKDFFRDIKSETTLSISSGDTEVSLPSSSYSIILGGRLISSSNKADRKMLYKTKAWFREKFPDSSDFTSGYPTYFYVESSTLYFYPESNDDYLITIDYVDIPSLGTDSSELSIREIELAVVAKATQLTFLSLEKFESAMIWEREYYRALRDLVIHDRSSVNLNQMSLFNSNEGQGEISSNPIYDPSVRSWNS